MTETYVQTRTNKPAPARAFDAIYDPVYTAPSQPRSIGVNTLEKVPQFGNFFSELPHAAPAYTYKFKNVNTVSLPSAPTVSDVTSSGAIGVLATPQPPAIDLVGRDRARFFKRPVVAMSAASGQPDANFVFTAPEQFDTNEESRPVSRAPVSKKQAPEPKSRTVGTQTKYRESDSQTDPWSPDYKIQDGHPPPEVLSIAHLTNGKGLPAALEEVKLIERLRERRKLEASLPTGNDEASFELRKKMLRNQELKDWSIREAEIRAEQEQRLKQLVSMLKEKEQQTQAYLEKRVADVRERQNKKRDAALQAIHRQRVKGERAVLSTQIGEPKSRKRDIVEEYVDKSSKIYAPITHDGVSPTHRHISAFEVAALKNFQGLTSLQQTIPSQNVTEQPVSSPKKVVPPVMKTRRGQQIVKDLEFADTLVQTAKLGSTGKPEAVTENIYKHLEPLVRPPTPSIEDENHSEDDVNAAVIFIQRLLRGRAVQNIMFDGRMNHHQLVSELRLNQSTTDRQQLLQQEDDASASNDASLLETELLLDLLQGILFSESLPPYVVTKAVVTNPTTVSEAQDETSQIETLTANSQQEAPETERSEYDNNNRVQFDGGVDLAEAAAKAAEALAAKARRVEETVSMEPQEEPPRMTARTQFKENFANSIIFQAIQEAAGAKILGTEEESQETARDKSEVGDQNEEMVEVDPNVSRSIVSEVLDQVVLPEVKRRQTLRASMGKNDSDLAAALTAAAASSSVEEKRLPSVGETENIAEQTDGVATATDLTSQEVNQQEMSSQQQQHVTLVSEESSNEHASESRHTKDLSTESSESMPNDPPQAPNSEVKESFDQPQETEEGETRDGALHQATTDTASTSLQLENEQQPQSHEEQASTPTDIPSTHETVSTEEEQIAQDSTPQEASAQLAFNEDQLQDVSTVQALNVPTEATVQHESINTEPAIEQVAEHSIQVENMEHQEVSGSGEPESNAQVSLENSVPKQIADATAEIPAASVESDTLAQSLVQDGDQHEHDAREVIS